MALLNGIAHNSLHDSISKNSTVNTTNEYIITTKTPLYNNRNEITESNEGVKVGEDTKISAKQNPWNSKGYFIHDGEVDCNATEKLENFIFDSYGEEKLSKSCIFPFNVFLRPTSNIPDYNFNTCVPLTKPDINGCLPDSSKTYCPMGLQLKSGNLLNKSDDRVVKNKYWQHFGVCSSSCSSKQSEYGFAYRVKIKKGGYEKRFRECIDKCKDLDPKFEPNIREKGRYCHVIKNNDKISKGHCICKNYGCYSEDLLRSNSSKCSTTNIPKMPQVAKSQMIEISAACASIFIVSLILVLLFLKMKNKYCFKNREKNKLSNNKMSWRDIKSIEHPDVVEDSINRQKYERKKMIRSLKACNEEDFDPSKLLNDQISSLKFVPRVEIDRSKFKVGKELGSGNFGTVFKGEAFGLFYPKSKTTVAIKTVTSTSNEGDIKTLIGEMKVMSYLEQHCNLVNMLGTCTSDSEENGSIWLFLEFCEKGDMKKFLMENRETFEQDKKKEKIIHNRLILTWAYDIAKGMEYLASKNVMHGDLAARNVLIAFAKTPDGRVLVAKVADFGMSKQMYENSYYRKVERNHVPWKWMAIEYFEDGKFQRTSDVWSYGVTIWELFSLGKSPYGGQGYEEVVKRLHEGYRLECPDSVKGMKTWPAEEIYQRLSEKCFQILWDKRCTFTEIASYLVTKLSNDEMKIYSHIETQNATQGAMMKQLNSNQLDDKHKSLPGAKKRRSLFL